MIYYKMFRPARKIAGGRRVRSAKIKTVAQRKETSLNAIILSARTSDLTHLISTVKIVPVIGSEPLTCTPVRVIYFHESGAYLVESSIEIDKSGDLEVVPHRFQRRLINKFREKKLIVKEIYIHKIILEMPENPISLSPTRLYCIENGFLCIGDHSDQNSIRIPDIPMCSSCCHDSVCEHIALTVNAEKDDISAEEGDAGDDDAGASDGGVSDEEIPELVPGSTVDNNLIEMVMSQTNCSRERAIEALQQFNNDIVEAIMNMN